MHDLKKVQNWHQSFQKTLEAHLSQPFAWGISDCMVTALDCIESQTGVNIWPDRWWTDEETALEAIRQAGGIEKALDEHLLVVDPRDKGAGSVMRAQRGDVGLRFQDKEKVVVVCDGMGFVGKTKNGRLRIPRSAVSRAWQAGR